jgi:dTDP-4-dehydrorhamnose reductase
LLVTGGSGYLGAELLRQAGPGAVGTYLSNRFEGGLRLDVRDAAAVERAVAGHEAVIHTAYVQSDAATIQAGSAAVAAACAATGARLVHVSSDVVFDGSLGRPYREDDAANPINDYGRAKRAAERAVADRCPGAAIVRPSLIYGGPGREPSRQEQDPLDAAAGLADIAFFTDELRSPVQVGDLATAILELVALDYSGPLHMGGAEAVSRFELAQLIVAARGGDPAAVPGASFAELGLVRPGDCRLDSSRAAALLGTRLRGVREALGASWG